MRVLPSVVCVAGLLIAVKLLTLGEAAFADEKASSQEQNASAARMKVSGPVTGVVPAAPLAAVPIPDVARTSSPPLARSPQGVSAPPGNVEPLTRDLQARSAQLDRRSAALDSEEAALTVAREQVQKRLSDLEALKGTLAAMEHDRDVRTEQDWAGLVRIYEAMRPANAAAIFDLLDTRVLIQVLDRMKDRKAAPILAAMLPERARLATQLLAQWRLKDDGAAKGMVAGRS